MPHSSLPPYALIAYLSVDPSHRVAFLAAAKRLVDRSRQDAGCLQYDLHQQTGNAGAFVIYEVWQSEALWRAHIGADHIAAFKEIAQKLAIVTKLVPLGPVMEA